MTPQLLYGMLYSERGDSKAKETVLHVLKINSAFSLVGVGDWFQDMTARELLQQRYTLPNGDTAWRSSPLVNAALEGKLVLLDGIHRVNAGTFAVLQRSV